MSEVETMNLVEIAALFATAKTSIPVPIAMRAYRRLIDIAYIDHGVSPEDSARATAFAAQVKDTVTEACRSSGNEGLVSSFQEAADAHWNVVKVSGRGTVIWDLEEAQLGGQR